MVIDWLRLFLMIGLGHRNAPDLLIVFILFYSLLYLEIYVREVLVLGVGCGGGGGGSVKRSGVAVVA